MCAVMAIAPLGAATFGMRAFLVQQCCEKPKMVVGIGLPVQSTCCTVSAQRLHFILQQCCRVPMLSLHYPKLPWSHILPDMPGATLHLSQLLCPPTHSHVCTICPCRRAEPVLGRTQVEEDGRRGPGGQQHVLPDCEARSVHWAAAGDLLLHLPCACKQLSQAGTGLRPCLSCPSGATFPQQLPFGDCAPIG